MTTTDIIKILTDEAADLERFGTLYVHFITVLESLARRIAEAEQGEETEKEFICRHCGL